MNNKYKRILQSSLKKCESERDNFVDLINDILQQQKLLLDNIDTFNAEKLANNYSIFMEITNFNDMLSNKLCFTNIEYETKWAKYKNQLSSLNLNELDPDYKEVAEETFEDIDEVEILDVTESNDNEDCNELSESAQGNALKFIQSKDNILDNSTLNTTIVNLNTNCPVSSNDNELKVIDSEMNKLSIKNLADHTFIAAKYMNKSVPNAEQDIKLNIPIENYSSERESMSDFATNDSYYNTPAQSSSGNYQNCPSSRKCSIYSESDKSDLEFLPSNVSSGSFHSLRNEPTYERNDSIISDNAQQKTIRSILDKHKPKGRFDRKAENIKCFIPDLSFDKDYSSSDSISASCKDPRNSSSKLSNDVNLSIKIKRKHQSDNKNCLGNKSMDQSKLAAPVIKEHDLPNVNEVCVVTYALNPFEFYITLVDGKDLTADMEKQFQEYTCRSKYFTNKLDAKLAISEYCIAYSQVFRTWNRAKVIQWNMTDPHNVDIQFVDFGEYNTLPYTYLLPIPNCFCNNPKQAIRCRLPNILPLEDKEWSQSERNNFNLICFDDTDYLKFKISSVSQNGGELFVDLKPLDGDLDLTISEMMVMTEHAKPIQSEFERNLMIAQIKHAQGVYEISEGETSTDSMDVFCDSMPVTYDTIADSMMGYNAQDDLRLCKHTNANGRCFKGSRCKLEHKQRRKGGITTDTEEVLLAPESTYSPNINEEISVLVTCIKVPTMLYGQVNHEENMDGKVIKDLYKHMNNADMIKSYERFKINPAVGEFVIAKNVDGRWYRATVLEVNSSQWSKVPIIQVFFVDFGDVLELSFGHIRKMKPAFANHPYQAIPFRISNIKPLASFNHEVFQEFVTKTNNKKFQVIVKYAGGHLIQGIFKDSFGNDVGEELVRKGLADPNNLIVMRQSDSKEAIVML